MLLEACTLAIFISSCMVQVRDMTRTQHMQLEAYGRQASIFRYSSSPNHEMTGSVRRILPYRGLQLRDSQAWDRLLVRKLPKGWKALTCCNQHIVLTEVMLTSLDFLKSEQEHESNFLRTAVHLVPQQDNFEKTFELHVLWQLGQRPCLALRMQLTLLLHHPPRWWCHAKANRGLYQHITELQPPSACYNHGWPVISK